MLVFSNGDVSFFQELYGWNYDDGIVNALIEFYEYQMVMLVFSFLIIILLKLW